MSGDAPPRLPVSETFTSLQGEGRLTGMPSFFVRASGCNLRCRWCDTPYASWDPDGAPRSIEAIADEAAASGVRHAVLTGGEPMLFDEMMTLSRRLRERGFHVTVETAGTILRTPDELACDLLSLSPKLANSTPLEGDPRDPSGAWRARHEARRLPTDVLQALLDHWPERQLKFVVAGPDDLAEIEALLARLRGVEPGDVMLMPEGTTVPEPARVRWAVDACLARGWRYCHRLHVELFGDVRGT